ncbi:hypothetical protein Pmani_009922 [Petrolisthes manimaculis]|uniref:SCP domain-containing protein n=1 Tax=Petrolisthes manimaculis TaxID=1843537 RepID=A0AAE1Q2F8_9EUCA|nr:hypothetical protein Pmani_009922 [Petrolisthes manimaculis]
MLTFVLDIQVARGNYGSQIAAANMQVLHWNQELADNAQSMADKCEEGYTNSPSQLRVCSQDYNVSENYYYIWSSNNITNIKSWTQVIDSWYDQGKDLSTSFYLGLNLTSAREYAQLVWANAYEVGCGGAYTETDIGITIRYFCLYGPGIMMDQPLYHYGPPATDCNGPVSSTYNDLCVNIPAEKEIHVVEPPRTSLAS